MAEQNAVITSTTYDHIVPTYAVVDKKSQNHLQQLQQQQLQAAHGPYIQYNTLIPVGKMTAYASQSAAVAAAQQQQPQQTLNKVAKFLFLFFYLLFPLNDRQISLRYRKRKKINIYY